MAGRSNTLRIIGGEWRSRKLAFPDIDGLRPTPDRVRETLFNWLAPVISGARCLDLFAGSGALGLEALSRGAGEVVMLDRDMKVVRQLQDNLRLLKCEHGVVQQAEAQTFLARPVDRTFDIVFLDPPYRKNLLAPCCELLAANHWLSPQARIYLELEKEAVLPALPAGWDLLRSKTAGQVAYHLALAG
ncbi:MAG: 16S rRNA (guanine(966)-N(2))-methyltransferase RsmD [Gammaproteobacteria bacterium]|nr:16S rRNA (guanine(966)-N(2))-methyltransferase RsmD [Gammaproteobacteria bacterium]MDH5653255.1 16S rRNA (guanine(966)-N(2))-methyltransferase RsmD [Gammaproteobacteria bacterium]